jgi:signal transduction histidine kinase
VGARSLRLAIGLPRLARSESDRVVAGVCAGMAERGRTDPTLVRLAFARLSFAAGAGIVLYVGLWALLPAPAAEPMSRRRKIFAVVILLGAAQLALHGLGIANSLVWPLLLATAGYLVWMHGVDLGMRERRAHLLGTVLAVLALGAFVSANARGTATTLLAPGAVAIAILLVLVPWAWRLVRERDAERHARIRVEERADLAARVHDSVLQTLALIQREPGDARRVATLARRQERELRSWLYPDREPAAAGTLADALEAAASEIEELHGIRVELVRTGDAPADDRVRTLVLAAREAMANAAKHSGADEISVFADATPEHVALFVRDRGSGFDPATVPADRRGIAHSIRERMERVGGSARIVSSPGEGTEVELELPGGER